MHFLDYQILLLQNHLNHLNVNGDRTHQYAEFAINVLAINTICECIWRRTPADGTRAAPAATCPARVTRWENTSRTDTLPTCLRELIAVRRPRVDWTGNSQLTVCIHDCILQIISFEICYVSIKYLKDIKYNDSCLYYIV